MKRCVNTPTKRVSGSLWGKASDVSVVHERDKWEKNSQHTDYRVLLPESTASTVTRIGSMLRRAHHKLLDCPRKKRNKIDTQICEHNVCLRWWSITDPSTELQYDLYVVLVYLHTSLVGPVSSWEHMHENNNLVCSACH